MNHLRDWTVNVLSKQLRLKTGFIESKTMNQKSKCRSRFLIYFRRADHFCQPLHVAMQLGLYLQLEPVKQHKLSAGREFTRLRFGLVFRIQDALRLVSEDPINVKADNRFYNSTSMKWFPADCLHRSDFHGVFRRKTLVLSDTQIFQHIAKCNLICHQIRGQKILP